VASRLLHCGGLQNIPLFKRRLTGFPNEPAWLSRFQSCPAIWNSLCKDDTRGTFMQRALTEPSTIVFPITFARADIACSTVTADIKKDRFLIFAGVKFYSDNIPRDMLLSNFSTTSPNNIYKKVDGEGYAASWLIKLRNAFTAAVHSDTWKGKAVHQRGVVRLLVTLPNALSKENGYGIYEKGRGGLEQSHDMVYSVCLSNIDDFFTRDVARILKMFYQ